MSLLHITKHVLCITQMQRYMMMIAEHAQRVDIKCVVLLSLKISGKGKLQKIRHLVTDITLCNIKEQRYKYCDERIYWAGNNLG